MGRGELSGLPDRERRRLFDALVRPHMAAAYNFARWMVRNEHDAEDLAQDAMLRAYRAMGGVAVREGRTWLLAIVRNVCLTWLARDRGREATTTFDEHVHTDGARGSDPETLLLERMDVERLRRAVEELPDEFREVVVLREMEGLTYKEIADVAGIPIGTVMSRLARARQRLQERLAGKAGARG